MRIRPNVVHILGQAFTIDYLPASSDILVNTLDLRNIGSSNHSTQRIYVSNDLGSDQERETVLHEVIHIVHRMTGATDEAEALVSAMAPILLDVIRRNPEVIAYLGVREEPGT